VAAPRRLLPTHGGPPIPCWIRSWRPQIHPPPPAAVEGSTVPPPRWCGSGVRFRGFTRLPIPFPSPVDRRSGGAPWICARAVTSYNREGNGGAVDPGSPSHPPHAGPVMAATRLTLVVYGMECWNLAVGFGPWPNTNSEILLAHSCLARGGCKV
jgi:hypothetical protein